MSSPDIQLKNDIAIVIHGFETQFKRRPDGTLQEMDVVTYAPQGDTKTMIIREVRRIAAVRPIEDCGDNIASLVARRLWERIEPAYLHWKQTNALPEHGTPLAAWPGVTKAQADILRAAGLRTVEDVAGASEIVLGKTGLANTGGLRALAQKFIDSASAATLASREAHLEEQKAELRDQMA
jgi:hypothetical protein